MAALSEDPEARPFGCAAFADDLLKLELSPQVVSASRRRTALVRTREVTGDRDTRRKVPEPGTVPVDRPADLKPPLPSPSWKKGVRLMPWFPQRSALAPGEVVGRYTIIGKLAEGGMGQVFLARNVE